MDLRGYVAIVTGGATGIGRAIGIKMAEVGADIVVSDIDADACQRTADEIAAMGVCSAGIPADVTDPEAVGRMVSETVSRFGQVDVWSTTPGSPERLGGKTMRRPGRRTGPSPSA